MEVLIVAAVIGLLPAYIAKNQGVFLRHMVVVWGTSLHCSSTSCIVNET